MTQAESKPSIRPKTSAPQGGGGWGERRSLLALAQSSASAGWWGKSVAVVTLPLRDRPFLVGRGGRQLGARVARVYRSRCARCLWSRGPRSRVCPESVGVRWGGERRRRSALRSRWCTTPTSAKALVDQGAEVTLNEVHTGNMAIHITFFTQFLWQFTHDSHTTHKICFVRLRRTLPLLVVLSGSSVSARWRRWPRRGGSCARAVEGDADVLVPQLDDTVCLPSSHDSILGM